MLINVTMLKLHKQLQSSKVNSGKPPACNCQKGVTDIRSGETDTKTNYKWMTQLQFLNICLTLQMSKQLGHSGPISWAKPDPWKAKLPKTVGHKKYSTVGIASIQHKLWLLFTV